MIAIIDERMPSSCQAELKKRGYDIIALPPFPRLPTPVASHPDMLIFLSHGKLITHKDYYSIARDKLDAIAAHTQAELILSDENISDQYPHDILFNAAEAGTHIFGRVNCISRHISDVCNNNTLTLVDIKQGYAKCSICIVDRNVIITYDESISSAAQKRGVEVLKIAPGHIRLDGYDTGFIGGASGLCGNNVYFCGNIDLHPDAPAIRKFCSERGKNVVCLGENELIDVGTIFFA